LKGNEVKDIQLRIINAHPFVGKVEIYPQSEGVVIERRIMNRVKKNQLGA
jgi:hypothetical protein